MPGKELTMSEHEDINDTAGEPKRAKYTIASTPPVAQESQKRSRWAELFDECRAVPGAVAPLFGTVCIYYCPKSVARTHVLLGVGYVP
jgi:hypothetical protein